MDELEQEVLRDSEPLGHLLDEMLKQEEWNKNHPILYSLKYVFYILPARIKMRIKFLYYDIIYFFQRHYRGFSDEDLWNGDIYIAKTLSKFLKEISNTYHFYPEDREEVEFISRVKRIAKAFDDYIVEKEKPYSDPEKLKEIYETMTELFKDGFISKLWD